jgi:hypothetical protein
MTVISNSVVGSGIFMVICHVLRVIESAEKVFIEYARVSGVLAFAVTYGGWF